MLRTVVTLAVVCGVVQSSGVHQAPLLADSPVVTASSSQYFERTFNRLVAPPVLVQPTPQQFVPVQPIQHIPVQPVTHIQPVHSFQTVQPVQSLQPVQPQSTQPEQPNISIAIATANAAAPVATILLPPYPFGFLPTFGLIPQQQPSNDGSKEQTTAQPTTQTDVKTTREPETTTQVAQFPQEPAGSDNNPVQASPSNQDVNFREYLAPPLQPSGQNTNFRQYPAPSPQPSNQNTDFRQYPAPSQQPSNQNTNFRQYLAPNPKGQWPQQLPLAQAQPRPRHHPHTHVHARPLKLKTLVEVQRVPLAYIAPPPIPHFQHHQAIKVVKHVHSFVPSRTKLIIRPASLLKTRSIQPSKGYQVALSSRSSPSSQNARPFNAKAKDIEVTTFRPFPIPNTKPPRL